MKSTNTTRGSAMVASLVSGAIAAAALAFVGQAVSGTSRVGKETRDRIISNVYAIELLEYFISQTPNRLKENLAAFPLCTMINHLSFHPVTQAPVVDNADDVADLVSIPISGGHRSYRVEIADVTNPNNLTPRGALCGIVMGSHNLAPNERYLVTVSVRWRTTSGQERATQVSGLVGGGLP